MDLRCVPPVLWLIRVWFSRSCYATGVTPNLCRAEKFTWAPILEWCVVWRERGKHRTRDGRPKGSQAEKGTHGHTGRKLCSRDGMALPRRIPCPAGPRKDRASQESGEVQSRSGCCGESVGNPVAVWAVRTNRRGFNVRAKNVEVVASSRASNRIRDE